MPYCVCSTLSLDTPSLRALVRIALRDAAYETPRVLYLYLYLSRSTQHESLLTAPCTVHLIAIDCSRFSLLLYHSFVILLPLFSFPPVTDYFAVTVGRLLPATELSGSTEDLTAPLRIGKKGERERERMRESVCESLCLLHLEHACFLFFSAPTPLLSSI